MAKTILFQGDSITDCRRIREDDSMAGHGYASMVAGELGYKYPGQYSYVNRGISGNRIVDVYARIKSDIINLKPDYMSLLIGVNDVWHELGGVCNGVSAEKYEKIYGMLIEEVKEALPEIKIMILEPFVLQGTATISTEEDPNRWNTFQSEVFKRAKSSHQIATKYNLPFVPLQKKFDEACQSAEPSYWLRDGVHPTAMGHNIIMKEWIKAFENMVKLPNR